MHISVYLYIDSKMSVSHFYYTDKICMKAICIIHLLNIDRKKKNRRKKATNSSYKIEIKVFPFNFPLYYT